MNRLAVFAFVTLLPFAASAQSDAEQRQRIQAIQDKMRRNEPPTAEDRAFMQQFQQRQRAEYARNHPPKDSTGLIPLPALGAGKYKGEEGGLYPGGQNTPPAAHRKAGMEAARQIAPIDGKIVMVSTGMSNTTMESQRFAQLVKKAQGINSAFQFVDCAQGGQTAMVTAKTNSKYWSVAEERLTAAGVTPKQAQIAWVKQANAMPVADFPIEVKKLQGDLAGTVRNLHEKYPNLKIVYLSSRIYGGYASSALNPEPHAYEGAFAVKWLIADQIAGKLPASPWLAWGPYLWTDGAPFTRADLAEDGTHPSPSGQLKVGAMLLDFLRGEPTAQPWFLVP